ncbi:MAG TPA: glycoside hydrolase domain-containing protein [Longimicrobium sp.]|nr:glycoside hydrolase domain-containing protein [Longimicrobium sp.]
MATNETEALAGVGISPVQTLPGTVRAATPGVKGFDANTVITPAIAKAFVDAGYKFAIRYVGRLTMANHDLTTKEALTILEAGLALMIVQHFKGEGWKPTAALGTQYGKNAGRFTKEIGVPAGVNVWCDLEGVAAGTPRQNVIDFCNNWHGKVSEAGYEPGLYVGFGPGLGPKALFEKLAFKHYWRAFNLNSDQVPAVRGVQLRQKTGKGTIGGLTTQVYDDDFTQTDALDGNAIWLAPD